MKPLGKDLIRKIREASLNGEEAHRIFSPPYRPVFSYDQILQKNPKLAAVNILLYLKNYRWHFPLMVRSENENDRHSGQISLPGGKRDEADRSFEHTAIRETSEEIGINPFYVRIIRGISPIYIPPSNFYVYPYISFTGKNPTFKLQESEAAHLIEFPVDSLLELNNEPELMVVPGSKGEVPVINFEGFYVWGATAMILSEFTNLLKNL